MDSVPQVPKIRMIEGFPHKLNTWWENFIPNEKLAIVRGLGCLPMLFKVNPDKHVIRASIHFWDSDRVVFAFKDFELTPTLEEICYFTSLKYRGRGQIIIIIIIYIYIYSNNRRSTGKKFLRYLGLKNNKKLRCFKHNWVSLDYLYERYGRSDSYKVFRKEFSCTYVHWQAKHPIAFVVALLGTLVFPREHGHISTCICSVVRVLFEAELFRALGKCKRKEANFFEGCNLFLQMWAMEHFHYDSNHIDSFYDRTRRFVSPISTDDWYGYLASRTSNQIQWKYPLPSHSLAYIRCRRFYYIELIGLKGLQPYAPVRVLQQFSQAQVIPLRANMRVFEISFGPNFEVPRSREILHEWNSILTIDIGNWPEREMLEYQVWLRDDRNSMSPEGQQGFKDIGMVIWIRHSHLGTKVVTPEMWAQMENIMQYLDNAGAGPSNVGESSSLPPSV
ncbi:hypothetical protein R3W88_027344 [Solanum pinnatisectum]|uniref:Aminotransferase-like plant mobile domain-containing protein n=1 Tax=Solanum pinnatisectum TaxID=50273 RepID=A0AAV9LJ84_9SOLN|nr:hypothetical protein R3W88_027344 [Solanum pinnatisectum]